MSEGRYTHTITTEDGALICLICGGPWVAEGHEVKTHIEGDLLTWMCSGQREA